MLSALSAPLVGLLHRNDDGSARYTSSPTTAADALRILSDRIENASDTGCRYRSMIPSLVVSDIRSALVEFLASTFALCRTMAYATSCRAS